MASFDPKPWWPGQRKQALQAVRVEAQPERRRPERSVTWSERLAERERRLAENDTSPPGWPPAAA